MTTEYRATGLKQQWLDGLLVKTVFKEQERSKTYKYSAEFKKRRKSTKFKSKVKVYIFVGRWLNCLSVEANILKNDKVYILVAQWHTGSSVEVI